MQTLIVSAQEELNYLELVAAALGVCSVWLVTRRDIRAFPVGIAMVGLYAYVFWRERLYADMLLQGFFAVMQAHGWVSWRRAAGSSNQRITIRRMRRSQWIWTLVLLTAGTSALGYLTSTYTDADIPWLDAFTTSLSVIAQIWLNRRYLDNWLLWIAVNITYLFQYSFKSLYITTGLYAVFLVMAVVGYRSWKAQFQIQNQDPINGEFAV